MKYDFYIPVDCFKIMETILANVSMVSWPSYWYVHLFNIGMIHADVQVKERTVNHLLYRPLEIMCVSSKWICGLARPQRAK